MQALHAMKGPGKTLFTLRGEHHVVELVAYSDGSLGLIRDRRHVGVWEPGDEQDCIDTFTRLTGQPSSAPSLALPRLIVMAPQQSPTHFSN